VEGVAAVVTDDRVAVQVDGYVGGVDHEAVAGARPQVGVKRRVLGDHLTAGKRLSRCRTRRQAKERDRKAERQHRHFRRHRSP
jgi:hypothetical protein